MAIMAYKYADDATNSAILFRRSVRSVNHHIGAPVKAPTAGTEPVESLQRGTNVSMAPSLRSSSVSRARNAG